MDWKEIPEWAKLGLLVFPILVLISLVLWVIGLFVEGINPFFWLIIPSIFFEEIFEKCCYDFSNNYIFNFIFIVLFWFVIGALVGLIVGPIKKRVIKKF